MSKGLDSIGRLRHRIEIVADAAGEDDKDNGGFRVPTVPVAVCKCWAAVGDGSYRANEHFTAAVGRVVTTVNFTIRHGLIAKHGIREGMIVLYGGRRHRIQKLYDDSHARDFVVLNTIDDMATDG